MRFLELGRKDLNSCWIFHFKSLCTKNGGENIRKVNNYLGSIPQAFKSLMVFLCRGTFGKSDYICYLVKISQNTDMKNGDATII